MLVEENQRDFPAGEHFCGRDISSDRDVLHVNLKTAGELNYSGVITGIKTF